MAIPGVPGAPQAPQFPPPGGVLPLGGGQGLRPASNGVHMPNTSSSSSIVFSPQDDGLGPEDVDGRVHNVLSGLIEPEEF